MRVYFFPDGRILSLCGCAKKMEKNCRICRSDERKAMNFSVSSFLWLILGGQDEMDREPSTSLLLRFCSLSSGLKIVKHGNRSVSSRCGSADY